MIFGLPGAALAMFHTARTEKRKIVGSLLFSAALTCALTGITEPIEFTFLFVAPLMYVIHCAYVGISYMLMHILKVGVGVTFSGGLIDFTLFGIMQGNSRTNWIWVVIVGIGLFFLYYVTFRLLIRKLNFATPGREADHIEPRLYTKADYKEKNKTEDPNRLFAMILLGLGGKNNISDIDCCATRLRVTVVDGLIVDDELLKSSGAKGIIRKGNGVQIIYGPQVSIIKSNLEDYIDSPISD